MKVTISPTQENNEELKRWRIEVGPWEDNVRAQDDCLRKVLYPQGQMPRRVRW